MGPYTRTEKLLIVAGLLGFAAILGRSLWAITILL